MTRCESFNLKRVKSSREQMRRKEMKRKEIRGGGKGGQERASNGGNGGF